jgi:hypothetical protein
LRGRGRGQVLIVAALGIALVIISTQAYVLKLSRTRVLSDYGCYSDHVLGIEQGTGHVVVASLVNVSRGGASSVLSDNLDRWEAFVSGDHAFGRCDLNATPASQSPYSGGIRLDWGTEGEGVSSACAELTLNVSGRGLEVDHMFTVNSTTLLSVEGSFTDLGGDTKALTVSVELQVDGGWALAGSVSLEYMKSSAWTDPTGLGSYQEQDYGNGTYLYTFTDDVPGSQVQVRAQVYDLRGVYVRAENSLGEG